MQRTTTTPGTIKSYLMSARHFSTFLLSSERILDSELTLEQKKQIDVVAETLKRWSASYRKLSNKRMLEKMDEDIENLVTPEKVAKFEKSDTVGEAVKILGELSADGEVEITQTVFATARDFLITQIVLANANRSGVISNITVGDFTRGKNILQAGKYVVSVKDHKTASTHGPVRVIMNGALYNWLDIYRYKLRSQLTTTSDAMFLSWNGKPLASGHVSRAVRSSWKKGGLDDPVHYTLCTLIITHSIGRNKEET